MKVLRIIDVDIASVAMPRIAFHIAKIYVATVTDQGVMAL
jgi:hypothetical protein